MLTIMQESSTTGSRILMALIIGATLSVLVTCGLLFLPIKVIEFYGDPFETDKTVVYPGDVISIKVKYCKYRNIPAVVTRHFVNSAIVTTPQTAANIGPSCGEVLSPVEVPTLLPPGEHKIVTTLEYKVNPFRIEKYTYETKMFMVLEKK